MILNAIIEKDDDGYFAQILELKDCVTQGKIYEEALFNRVPWGDNPKILINLQAIQNNSNPCIHACWGSFLTTSLRELVR